MALGPVPDFYSNCLPILWAQSADRVLVAPVGVHAMRWRRDGRAIGRTASSRAALLYPYSDIMHGRADPETCGEPQCRLHSMQEPHDAIRHTETRSSRLGRRGMHGGITRRRAGQVYLRGSSTQPSARARESRSCCVSAQAPSHRCLLLTAAARWSRPARPICSAGPRVQAMPARPRAVCATRPSSPPRAYRMRASQPSTPAALATPPCAASSPWPPAHPA
jgi:hypothetical protein